ncbi:MAG: YqcI/YcgG family protein [Propionivibrio sp.]|nr:YqcI/YcgG family protein [Propionivibrio sp.]MBK7357103.1 YqcI/YcgG family protein [Propionivibrio sp.]MBK8401468.1 YqcI/YcgG family protein [Propionivibrio sp.]MBK8745390.1 YqcI/YcgG family protein [Propionivibrio sp.]
MLLTSSRLPPDYRQRVLLGDLVGRAVQPPDWFIPCLETFHTTVIDPDYPCYFGSAAAHHGELYYTISDSRTQHLLARTLQNFLANARLAPDERRNLTIFFPPDALPLSHSEYKQRFWSVLQALHQSDASPWPDSVSTDPNQPNWEFCFAGEPIFAFCADPSYRSRTSRNLGPGMIILMQPRRSFFGIEGHTRAGIQARNKTRERLEKWDHMPAHPDLGVYGESNNREWKQYVLPDDNSSVTGICPFVAQDASVGRESTTNRDFECNE